MLSFSSEQYVLQVVQREVKTTEFAYSAPLKRETRKTLSSSDVEFGVSPDCHKVLSDTGLLKFKYGGFVVEIEDLETYTYDTNKEQWSFIHAMLNALTHNGQTVGTVEVLEGPIR